MKAHELLANPAAWTDRTMARRDLFIHCEVDDPKAICWCALGALKKCYGSSGPTYERAVNTLAGYIRGFEVVHFKDAEFRVTGWNDNPDQTHDNVIRILKELDL